MTNRTEITARQEGSGTQKRVAGVIVTHGQLANELLAAAEAIVGTIEHITAVSIGWHDDVDVAQEAIERAMARVSDGSGVMLLTDMFGGTPTNIAAMFLHESGVEVVTGVNLPMVIKLAAKDAGKPLTEVAQTVCAQGRDAIRLASELLAVAQKS